MKKLKFARKVLALILCFLAVAGFAVAQTQLENDSTLAISIGDYTVPGAVVALALAAVVEFILRKIPSNKYASILGVLHLITRTINNKLPNNVKQKSTKPTDGPEQL